MYEHVCMVRLVALCSAWLGAAVLASTEAMLTPAVYAVVAAHHLNDNCWSGSAVTLGARRLGAAMLAGAGAMPAFAVLAVHTKSTEEPDLESLHRLAVVVLQPDFAAGDGAAASSPAG